MLDNVKNYFHYLLVSYNFITVAIELVLIGCVVYSVMRFLRGTGGEKLFKGIVFVLLIFGVVGLFSRQFSLELDRIEWVFQYILGAVLVVAVIAFQPEIRRGLMQLGGTEFSRSSAPEMQRVIEQVVDTCQILSKKQVGCLIAFERSVGLSTYIDEGIALDAKVTIDLLHTIFWPGTPLHDMGVVIRNGQIAAASVQFPLAEHGEYDRLLGSRHRSAIGLSKESDAVVVVVSEETGRIGIAVSGKFTGYLTIDQLHATLTTHLVSEPSNKYRQSNASSTKEGV
jgi:diadenylate cyclase